MADPQIKQGLHTFIRLLNQERYWEAHETLERLWFPIRKSKRPQVTPLKLLINGAVILELQRRGRPDAAGRVLCAFSRKRRLLYRYNGVEAGMVRLAHRHLRQKLIHLTLPVSVSF